MDRGQRETGDGAPLLKLAGTAFGPGRDDQAIAICPGTTGAGRSLRPIR